MKKMWKQFTRIFSGERPPIDVWHYLVGNYRYWLYYSWGITNKKINLVKLIRRHIREQIDYRIKVMNKECYNRGECIKCGCQTTMLQMCSKACEDYCYPPMMSAEKWKIFLRKRRVKFGDIIYTIDMLMTTKVFKQVDTPTSSECIRLK